MPDPLSQLPAPTSDADIAQARKWFKRAKEVADSRQYDYAIEAYISGLKLWPDGIEEGHKPLRAVGHMRKMAGGKPLGFLESRKHSTSSRDARQNMLNAEFLWAHDPANPSHMETMILNAAKAGCIVPGSWMAAIHADALAQEKKLSAGRYSAVCDALDAIGDLAQKAEQYATSAEAFNSMVRVAGFWRAMHPNSQDAPKAYNDAQSKLTIVRGRFGTSDTFRDSIRDKGAQDDMRDKDRVIQADTRVDELLEKARIAFEAEPTALNKLNAYVDLLMRRERDEDERKAIEALATAHLQLKNYSLKVKADDLRIKQLNRVARRLVAQLQANPSDDEVKARARQHKLKQLEFEIGVFEERSREYPTDLKVRFRLGELYFKARRYDEAIPFFQQAQADGRHRDASRLHVGRCFFEKGLHNEAISVLKQAIEGHELGLGDEVGKQLHYWLARSAEDGGQRTEAMEVYGQLIQLDYNYLDARPRLEALRGDASAARN